MAETRRQLRRGLLAGYGARAGVLDELLVYGEPPIADDPAPPALPLADEPHVATWCGYEAEAEHVGAVEALRPHFVQLRFPIADGISQHHAYRRATRAGHFEEADAFHPGLPLRCPNDVELVVHPTMGGRVPVLTVGDRADFVGLLQALTERNEPSAVPSSMGACLVRGLNNWGRIADYRKQWEQGGGDPGAWDAEFRRVAARKELYQDRLVILGRGPYSAVAASDVGLDEQQWLDQSSIIRREHEFTHYFTYRIFGTIRSHLLDEIVADYVGLAHAFGQYRPELALQFLGLEGYPSYREGGRLSMYRGEPPLSDGAMGIVRHLAYRIVRNLAVVDAAIGEGSRDLETSARLTLAIFALSPEELSSDDGPQRVIRNWRELT